MRDEGRIVRRLVAAFAAAALALPALSAGVTVKAVPGEGALEKARDEVRQLLSENGGEPPAGGITVELANGVYRLTEPLTFGRGDSGSPSSPVVWKAANRGMARISGAAAIREVPIDWTKSPASLIPEASRKSVKAYSIPGEGELPGFRNGGLQPQLTEKPLSVNSGGRRCAPARWPNDLYARTGEPVTPIVDSFNEWGENWYASFGGDFHVPGVPQLPAWASEPDLWAFGMWRFEWSNSTTPVLSVNASTQVMCVDTNQNQYGFLPNAAYYVFNAFSELDREGEWAVDRRNRTVYIWPGDERAPDVALTERLFLAWSGFHDVTFEGLVFENTRDDAIHLSGAENVTIRASLVRRTGGDGIVVVGSKNCRVVGCDLRDIGKAGVRITGGDYKTLEPGANTVENCHIHHYGRAQPVNSPGITMGGVGNRAVRNLVHHGEQQGITCYGNDHYIGFNIVHDVCRYANDAGSFYISGYDWSKRGTVLEYNVFFMCGKQPLTSHTNGIYLDGWSSGNTVRGNIINRAVLGVYMSGGNDNICVNNIVLNTSKGIVLSSLGADSFAKGAALKGRESFLYRKLLAGKELYETDLWRKKYPRILDILKVPNPIDAHNAYWYVVTNNVMCSAGGMVVRNREKVISSHRISGNVEMEGDPGFVDYEGFNWELKPNSPIRKTLGGGTRFGEMGLYDSPDRFSPAVKHGAGLSRPRPIRIEYNQGDVTVAFAAPGAPHWDWRNIGQATPEWREYTAEYKPAADGRVDLVLSGGNGFQTAYDDVRVTGAKLLNGGFEAGDKGWRWDKQGRPSPDGNKEGPWGVVRWENAVEGKKVCLAHNGLRVTQTLEVKKGVPLKVTFKACEWIPDYLKPYLKKPNKGK